MAWLQLHTALIRHRKLKQLARSLDITPVVAVGHLTTLWGNVLELAENGDITKWSKEDIAEYACYAGDATHFYASLMNSSDGWLDNVNGKILIHDWWDYAGRYLNAKYRTANPLYLESVKALYCKSDEVGLKTDFRRLDKIDKIYKIYNIDSLKSVFDTLWLKYPKRLGKQTALRHFKAQVKTEQDQKDIQTALNNYLNYITHEKIGENYIKHGATWFNQWRDWVDYEPKRKVKYD